MNTKDISFQIVEKLKPLSPNKIILFGSFANGNSKKDSDVDLMVVTSDNYIPGNYNEHMEIYLKVSNILTGIKKKYPMDIIVQTIPMYKKFNELGGLFSKEINKKGIVLYEGNNQGMD